jgi:hypothetical protein
VLPALVWALAWERWLGGWPQLKVIVTTARSDDSKEETKTKGSTKEKPGHGQNLNDKDNSNFNYSHDDKVKSY